MFTAVCCVLLCSAMTSQAFIFNLDLQLHGALTKGNPLAVQAGPYLKDSFRKGVLVPAFASVVQELKQNKRDDVITELILTAVSVVLVGGLLFLWLKMRHAKQEMSKFQAAIKERV